MPYKVCPNCSKEFYTKESRVTFCSRKCYLEYIRKHGAIGGKGKKSKAVGDAQEIRESPPKEKTGEDLFTLEAPSDLTPLERDLLNALKAKRRTLDVLSEQLDRSKQSILNAARSLFEKGYDVVFNKHTETLKLETEPKHEFTPLELHFEEKEKLRIGVLADTHLGSKYQQLTLLLTAYAEFEKRKVDFVVHGGDLVDGIGMYRGHEYELFLHSADEQLEYAEEKYPRLQSGTGKTYMISGNHPLSFKKKAGYNIVRMIARHREDIIHIGDVEGEFTIGSLRFQIKHPEGGVSYARSYRLQKMNEALGRGEDIPDMLIFGHFHIALYMPYLGTHNWGAACLQAQTPYLRGKGLAPDIGFWIVELVFDKEGKIWKVLPEYFDLSHAVKERDY